MKNAVELAPGFRNGLMPSFAAVQTARLPALRLLLALASLIGWYTALQRRAQAVWIVVAQVPLGTVGDMYLARLASQSWPAASALHHQVPPAALPP